MNEHDKIRELLALAAADALTSAEEKEVAEHVRSCIACSNELEAWRPIASELRRLPTPQPSPWLVPATLARAEAKLTEQAEHDWNRRVMIFVLSFAWLLTIVSWPVFHFVSGRFERLLGPQFSHTHVQPNMDQFCRVHCPRVARGRGGRSNAGNPAARRKEAGMSRFTKELRVIPEGSVDLCMVRLFVPHRVVVLLRCTKGSGDGQIAALGTSAAGLRIFPAHGGLGCADRIHLRRREAAADAVRNVDAAGDLHSECDRDDLVFPSPRPSAEAVPRLRACRKGKVPILSALRHFAAANVPEM